MSDSEKFEGFKRKMIEENEEKYGKEVREKYGEEAAQKSNAKMMSLTEKEYGAMQDLAGDILQRLEQAVKAGLGPKSEEAQEIARMHKSWLRFSWEEYSISAHRGLCRMYIDDPRFTEYYDKNVSGCALLLHGAVNEMPD